MVKQNPRKDKQKSSYFTRIFLPEVGTNEQEIPSRFVRDVLKKVPHRMVLQNSSGSGGSWPVKVVEAWNGVFFRDGWRKFVKDHSLRKHDFLRFNYDGTPRLVVQIFEKSGLLVDYSAAFETDEEEEVLQKGAAREEKLRCFVTRCKNDFFERRIKSYNVGRPFIVFVPTSFAQEHFRGTTMITLKNAEGETWEVNCLKSDRKFEFLGGWKRFAAENSLHIGDVCMFELVRKMTLLVHVF